MCTTRTEHSKMAPWRCKFSAVDNNFLATVDLDSMGHCSRPLTHVDAPNEGRHHANLSRFNESSGPRGAPTPDRKLGLYHIFQYAHCSCPKRGF